jgi:asparagine synthetase B (glutamine-hydrolysing)
MCGILLVKSQHEISSDLHHRALSKLTRRGPDFIRSAYRNNIFIAHSVLRITGSDHYYHQNHTDFLAYNGEIYNWKNFGQGHSDIDLMHDVISNDCEDIKKIQGAWAWVWTDFHEILYASDAQGERCLYRYQDADILVICSDVAPILEYIPGQPQDWQYTQKHWPIFSRTPWRGIDRVTPGCLHDAGGNVRQLDSIFDWVDPRSYHDIQDAWQDFRPLWNQTIHDMVPDCAFGVSFSGGVDSSVILNSLPGADHFYVVDCIGKDSVSLMTDSMLCPTEQHKIIKIQHDYSSWARTMIHILNETKMPIQSWSFVGQWSMAEACQERVMFTGLGADELFGGYDIYTSLQYTDHLSASPYSLFDAQDQEASCLWQKCLEAYQGDPKPATLLMDYLTQVSAVDMRGVDSMSMWHGVEPRSPFVHPEIIRFALNLPWHLRIGKPLIKKLFLERWSPAEIWPKQGFAGHCNDSSPWLDVKPGPGDRAQQWKTINRLAWQKYASSLDRQTMTSQI